MKKLLTAIAVLLAPAMSAQAGKEQTMHHAAGEFDVTLKPVSVADEPLMRMSIDKIFHGDLQATSLGQMMAGGNDANGARVYVALETVTGSLKGRTGSFILAHRGTMSSQGQTLSVIIVPDSGTDQLSGISGTLDIEIRDGKHFYTMDYALPE